MRRFCADCSQRLNQYLQTHISVKGTKELVFLYFNHYIYIYHPFTLHTDSSSELLKFRRIQAEYHPLVSKRSERSMRNHVVFQQCSFKLSCPRIFLCSTLNTHNIKTFTVVNISPLLHDFTDATGK